MREAWRWFGPDDPVSLDDIRQAGATDIVTALHEIPIGAVWPAAAIRERQALIEDTPPGRDPLCWSVVESVPVHDDIKRGAQGWEAHADAFAESISNLAQCGIRTVCYNFMPIIDWTRTDLDFEVGSGARALRFDADDFAAFELFILRRAGAEADYDEARRERALTRNEALGPNGRDKLARTIMAGLPGRMTEAHDIGSFRDVLAEYGAMSDETLRQNLFRFLERVLPTAERVGARLAIHPDDPPRPLLGLPRVMCTADDVQALLDRFPGEANGLTLCVGTYGVRPDNDLPEMARRFGARIRFAHLRGTRRDRDDPLSFIEAEHLDSDIDMLSVIRNLMAEERRRADEGAPGEIPARPDHGHRMLDDLGKRVNPGYSAIGRLKGLAEIRGAFRAIDAIEGRGARG